MNHYDKSVIPHVFVTTCKNCNKDVRLVKDSLEGQGAYCFDCSHLAMKRLK